MQRWCRGGNKPRFQSLLSNIKRVVSLQPPADGLSMRKLFCDPVRDSPLFKVSRNIILTTISSSYIFISWHVQSLHGIMSNQFLFFFLHTCYAMERHQGPVLFKIRSFHYWAISVSYITTYNVWFYGMNVWCTCIISYCNYPKCLHTADMSLMTTISFNIPTFPTCLYLPTSQSSFQALQILTGKGAVLFCALKR